MINLNKGTELKLENIMLSESDKEALSKGYPDTKKAISYFLNVFISDFRINDYKYELVKDFRNRKYASYFLDRFKETCEEYKFDLKFFRVLSYNVKDIPELIKRSNIEGSNFKHDFTDLRILALLVLNYEVYDPNFENLTRDNIQTDINPEAVINYFETNNSTFDFSKLVTFISLLVEFDLELL